MELGVLGIVAIVVLVVWYFGSSINSIVKGSGEMASDEFSVFRREQKIRLHKSRITQTKTVKDLTTEEVLSDEEFDKIFSVIDNGGKK